MCLKAYKLVYTRPKLWILPCAADLCRDYESLPMMETRDIPSHDGTSRIDHGRWMIDNQHPLFIALHGCDKSYLECDAIKDVINAFIRLPSKVLYDRWIPLIRSSDTLCVTFRRIIHGHISTGTQVPVLPTDVDNKYSDITYSCNCVYDWHCIYPLDNLVELALITCTGNAYKVRVLPISVCDTYTIGRAHV